MNTTLADSPIAQIDALALAAAAAADTWAHAPRAARARLLDGLAGALEAQRETLVPLADAETHLGPARLNGELDRTAFQLREFARLLTDGEPFRALDDPAVPGAPPAGHPHMALVRVAIGPVAMFAASNFPFAFSVLGGDTASALAAGCPVIVKAHPGHPLLSRKVFELACAEIAAQQLPAGILGMVEGASVEVGVHLVTHPAVCAVAFTGSFKGGTALQAHAQARQRPIPFYGELGSVNPVIVLPAALDGDAQALAQTLAGSIALGSGQFCTSPGIVIVRDDDRSAAFLSQLAASLARTSLHEMLTPGIRRLYDAGVDRLDQAEQVRALLGPAAGDDAQPGAYLGVVDAATFLRNPELHEEVFGPACLAVRVSSAQETIQILQAIGGSLTATIWGADSHNADNARLVNAAMDIAGRVLFCGVPTGVAVTAAQQHGGPWPASTQAFTTSVGHAALDRFLRPVALQDAPAWLLDDAAGIDNAQDQGNQA